MRPTIPRQLRLKKTVWRIPSTKPSPRTTAAPEQTALRAAYYRGGTSRAVILQPQDLPSNHATWKGLFRQVLGTVGLGEAYGKQLHRLVKNTASLGKICLVEPYLTTKEDETTNPHIDYTFVSMDTKYGHLDVEGNCGNMLSAVGPYAYNARLLPSDVYAIKDGDVTITIRNTNTMQLVQCTFAVIGGQAAVTGSYVVDGVNGKGSKISLAFQDPLRSTTGKTFPTGNRVDVIEGFKVTCVDGAVPVVFVRADTIGVPGTILPHELKAQGDKLDLFENIRRAAAVDMGIAHSKQAVPRTIPKIAIVSQSSQHDTVSGATLKPSQMDIIVRFISDNEPHSAIPLTGALTTAVAARMPGTIVEQLLAPEEVMPGTVTIAHPSGRAHVKLDYNTETKPPKWVASVSTTAQRLFEGKAFWTKSSQDAKEDTVPESDITRHARGLAFVSDSRSSESPASLIERFYKGGLNTTTEFSSTLTGQSKDPPQPPSPSIKPDLQLITPSPTRDTTHLLRELSTLRTSLSHFTTLYPSPSSLGIKSSTRTPSTISHHLSAIASHISILTSSLKHIPRPPRTVTPDRQKGEQWRHWAKTFSQWDEIKSLREAEKKIDRRQRKKGRWERWRDSELNALTRRARPVVMGKWRRKLLQERDIGGKDWEKTKDKSWEKALEGLGGQRDGGAGTRRKNWTDVKGGKTVSATDQDGGVPQADGLISPKRDDASKSLQTSNIILRESKTLDATQESTPKTTKDTSATEPEPAHIPAQHPQILKWPSFRDRPS
ncbi:uncharacterized protein N0V89_004158 [Didymosphaeria variabile]|uniref:DUF453-domain-containing protein n=1 Tax=Didymosphaeria variabile TaxID=1932322 RepID=A0A9W8XNY4_9PLEO|nr:uncharacterized protein N0V89_004158 [Didymosphaeria variabile]KAJ4356130.1 hypothetical protein N0V89_004158 [Didymosphaeria variabile]